MSTFSLREFSKQHPAYVFVISVKRGLKVDSRSVPGSLPCSALCLYPDGVDILGEVPPGGPGGDLEETWHLRSSDSGPKMLQTVFREPPGAPGAHEALKKSYTWASKNWGTVKSDRVGTGQLMGSDADRENRYLAAQTQEP